MKRTTRHAGAMAAALAASLALPIPPAAAQDTSTILAARRAAQALASAAVALDEAEGARDRVAALTRTVRAYEDGLAALREGIRRAAADERAARAALEARRGEVASLTGALAGLRRDTGPLLLLHPGGPLATARSAMAMAAVTPALQDEVADLAARADEIAQLRALQEGAEKTLSDGLAEVQQARLSLSQALSERTPLPRRHAEDPEALAALLAGADTLEAFAAGLGAVPLAASATSAPSFPALRGSLPLPASGTQLRGFGEADAAGIARDGLVLATAPLALVTAPAAATVRYAGPLPDYGNVIVLEPAAGYLMVLAGLGELYVSEDEVVPAGAPLGLTGDGAAAPEPEQGGGGHRSETLYIELRQGGAPIDPAPWFARAEG